MKLLFLSLVFLCPVLSYGALGGSTAGDGGHGVVCEGYTELLDMYEMRHHYHVEPYIMTPSYRSSWTDQLNDEISSIKAHAVQALGAGHPFIKMISEMYHIDKRLSEARSVEETDDFGHTVAGSLQVVAAELCSWLWMLRR